MPRNRFSSDTHGPAMTSGDGFKLYDQFILQKNRMLDKDFKLNIRGELVIHVHLPSAWNDKSGSRMILRLKNASTGEVVSMRVTYGKTYQIDNDQLPKGAYGSLVAWIDTVSGGQITPYTARIKPKSLKEIEKISSLATLQQPADSSQTALGRTEQIVNACRWISTPESRRQTKRLTKNIMKRVGAVNSGFRSCLRTLLNSATTYKMIDDGTDIVSQLLFLYFTSCIQVVARTQTNGIIFAPDDSINEIIQELNAYKSFPSLRVLQRCLIHSTSNNHDKTMLRKSVSSAPHRKICD